jgi:hypothetical protein
MGVMGRLRTHVIRRWRVTSIGRVPRFQALAVTGSFGAEMSLMTGEISGLGVCRLAWARLRLIETDSRRDFFR